MAGARSGLMAGAGRPKSGVAADRRRLMSLLVIMIVVSMVIVVSTQAILYRHAIRSTRARLQVTAKSQARLIEAIARQDAAVAHALRDEDPGYDPFTATLGQIADAHEDEIAFGETGEFTLARREGDLIVFLLQHRGETVKNPEPVPFASQLAAPMRKALQGESGTILGFDYRGTTVLAAYEPVAVLNLGIVAKIDLAEVRAPFIRSGLAATGLALLVLLAGTAVSYRIGNPIILRLETYTQELEKEVTERTLAQQELETQREHLEELVEERTSDLAKRASESEQLNSAMANVLRDMQEMNAHLEATSGALARANEELESFAHSVSHDLRAPLRGIDGFARILEEDYGHVLDEEGRRLLGVVQKSAKEMGQLIDDLLKFSRLSRAALAPAPIDMAALARDVWASLGEDLQGRDVDFAVSALPTAIGDQNLLRQVVVNLLSNAVKYTRARSSAAIEVTGRHTEGEVVYSVKDNGVGFDMQHYDMLFGVFQRLHRAEEFEGTGVGLALVQRIVHRHGGRVWAEGEVDHGAVFHFSLPAQKEDEGHV